MSKFAVLLSLMLLSSVGAAVCQERAEQRQPAVHPQAFHDIVRADGVTFPPRNYDVCLGDSIIPKARFTNVDTVMHPSIVVRFIIRNVVTRIAVYDSAMVLRNVPAGASIDTTFPPYRTNPNILSELGTFYACAISTGFDEFGKPLGDQIATNDTACIRIFGVRRTVQPFRDASNGYSRIPGTAIPDQTLWTSIGAEVVDGETATWDPPPPRDTGAGYGPLGMHSPVIKIDRLDINGNPYVGSNAGDTLTSFPINLLGQTRAVLTFDYQRAGRRQYPWLWDQDTMYGPEQTIVDVNGKPIRVGDSLILEFKSPTDVDCNPVSWDEITAIDGGQDFEYKPIYVNLSTLPKNYFTADFRFRFRLKAKDNNVNKQVDDADAWFIDNPTLIVPRLPEIEVSWTRVVNPYSKIPASQAVLPVYVMVKNYCVDVAVAFPLKVVITNHLGAIVYSQVMPVNSLPSFSDTIVRMPDWDARTAPPGEYMVNASIDQAGYDDYEGDNSTYSKFYLNVDNSVDGIQEFAYDDAGITPAPGGGNDIPTIMQIKGAGIGFTGNSGSFAMKFTLAHTDSIYGVRLYFANGNAAPDAIRILLYYGSPASCVPGDTVLQAGVQAAFEDQRRGGFFNQFWSYYFPKPIVLPGADAHVPTGGIYWIAVSQLSLETMDLGGDASRCGSSVLVEDATAPVILPNNRSPYGTQWGPNPEDNSGDVRCRWAMEITAGSGAWSEWMPASGWWPRDNGLAVTSLLSGSYIPMIRPIVGSSSASHSDVPREATTSLLLEPSAPNPFTPSHGPAVVRYTLADAGYVKLTIYNQLGDIVRTLISAHNDAGSYHAVWDGRDVSGAPVAEGTYYCRLTSGNDVSAIKIVLLK